MKDDKNIVLYLESNPNPNALKFVANQMLVPYGLSFDFVTIAQAHDSPLAQELFMYPFVQRVFLMNNFVTVTKAADVEWIEVQNVLKNHIEKFLETDQLPVNGFGEDGKDDHKDITALAKPAEDSEAVRKIKQVLDEYIKPAVEQDGGAIVFHNYRNKVLTVSLQGSCSGCPASEITLKTGIENLMKEMLPNEVELVEALNG